jgi:hypothetical protein
VVGVPGSLGFLGAALLAPIIIGGCGCAGTSAGIATLHFCGTTSEKCELAHTSPR